ncbi:hypothetical protein [Maribellus sediminis]|uniref:hypothetical protein n=1 Tax=Maribellus sediminis TaxID=2696285 RepID=UPI00197D7BBD|nr:hypothetical protein [Maribellus sediminis]
MGRVKSNSIKMNNNIEMKNSETYLSELKEIRKMMEESSRFLSLSGLSGVLVGIIALVGAYIIGQFVYADPAAKAVIVTHGSFTTAIIIAVVVLVLSLLTVILLTYRRAKKAGKKIWNRGSKLMLLNLAIPLVTGGLLIIIFIRNDIVEIIAPGCLIFYGLALINAAKFTRQEIFWLGILEVSLGLLAALFSSLGLIFWALGFGVLHIIYGIVMYFRYEYNTKE